MKNIFKYTLFTLSLVVMLIVCGCTESAPNVDKFNVIFKDYDGTVLREEIIQAGHSATAPADPIRYGYIFIGWDNNYTNVQKDIVCIAQYEKDPNVIIEYTVVFKDYDGTILKEEVVEEGSFATAPEDPVREGFEFTGWDKDYTNVTTNLTVNATYKEIKNTCTVVFDSNGGTAVESQEVDPSSKATKPTDPTREGYNFLGWFLGEEEWSFIGYVVTEDMTLVAKWEVITYNITYNYNGGILFPENLLTYTVEDEFTLNTPYKQGYEFVGWNDLNEQQITIEKGTTGDLEFNANYKQLLATITYDVNGGDVLETTSQTVMDKIQFTMPTPTREGYTFIGWAYQEKVYPAGLKYAWLSSYDSVEDIKNAFLEATAEYWEIGIDEIPFDTVENYHDFWEWGTFFATKEEDVNINYPSPSKPSFWNMPNNRAKWEFLLHLIYQTMLAYPGERSSINYITSVINNNYVSSPLAINYNFYNFFNGINHPYYGLYYANGNNDSLILPNESEFTLVATWKLNNEFDFELSEDETYYKISGIGTVVTSDVVIPSEYKGLPVRTIEEGVFANSSIRSITIPTSIKKVRTTFNYSLVDIYYEGTIKDWCEIDFKVDDFGYSSDIFNPMYAAEKFYMLDDNNTYVEVTDIIIPEGVTKISAFQFAGIYVNSIEIPSTVTEIEDLAFVYCTAPLNVDNENENYSTIGGNLYNKDQTMFILYTGRDFVLPDTINAIHPHAFITWRPSSSLYYTVYENGKYCGTASNPYLMLYGLVDTTVTTFKMHPETVTIAYSVFKNYNINEIFIPASVKYIGKAAFWYHADKIIYAEATSEQPGWIDEWNLPSKINLQSDIKYRKVVYDIKQVEVNFLYENVLAPIDSVDDVKVQFLTDFYNWCIKQGAFTEEEVSLNLFIGENYNGTWFNYTMTPGNPSNLYTYYDPSVQVNYFVDTSTLGNDEPPVVLENTMYFLNDSEMHEKYKNLFIYLEDIFDTDRIWSKFTEYVIYDLGRWFQNFRSENSYISQEKFDAIPTGMEFLVEFKTETVKKTLYVNGNEGYTLPIPQKENEVFIGWTDGTSVYKTIYDNSLEGKTLIPIFATLDEETNQLTVSDITISGYVFQGWITSTVLNPTKNIKVENNQEIISTLKPVFVLETAN